MLPQYVIIGLVDPFQHGTFLPGGIEVYITVALTALAGLTLGLTISAIVPNSDRAMSFLPLLLLPQVIFAGTLFPLTNPTRLSARSVEKYNFHNSMYFYRIKFEK